VNHWTEKPELGNRAAYGLTFFLCRSLPLPLIRLVCLCVSFFYSVGASGARRESRRYLEHAAAAGGGGKLSIYKHIASFSLAFVERIEAWTGRINFGQVRLHGDGVKEIFATLEAGKGAMVITSHLGNVEFLRGLADRNLTGLSRRLSVLAIVDYGIDQNFNKMAAQLNPDFSMRIINARKVGIETTDELLDCIDGGGLVVIAGDRTQRDGGKTFKLPFLDKDAPFPAGPFELAGILRAPVYYLFGLRDKVLSLKTRYEMYIYRSKVTFEGSRKQRQARCLELAREYSAHLEELCKKEPYQWYNFYDFWAEDSQKERMNGV
jgi:predicted LPLAT superfamily acyltransferase